MLAEEINFSGVLAVVSGGLFLSLRRDSFLTYSSRHQGFHVWEAVLIVLKDLTQQQRNLLKTLNKKEEINNDIMRQQFALPDLEQEKMR